MAFLAPSTQIGREESIYWKPRDAAELEEGRAALRADYANYRTQALAITSLITTSTKAAETTPDKAAYEAKVTAVMDAYVNLVASTSKYDTRQHHVPATPGEHPKLHQRLQGLGQARARPAV